MQLKVYKTNDDSRVCLKALEHFTTYNLYLNDEINILNPTFTLGYSSRILEANYCYCDIFKRYYYINNISVINGERMVLSCTVDPLMSFYNNFKSSMGYCIRNQNDIQPWIKDDLRPIAPYTTTRVLKLDNNIFNIDKASSSSSTNFLLTVSGANKKETKGSDT